MKKIAFNSFISPYKFCLNFIVLFMGLFLLSSIKSYSQVSKNYHEKVFLHFDKPYYSAGENIWFKAYLVDAKSNQPIALSKVLYVELIDPSNKIMDSKILKIEAGGAAGDFQLPSELISGKYKVRAYTSYMRNFDNAYFFRKDIHINNLTAIELDAISIGPKRTRKERKKVETTDQKPDVQFFPEGGDMVNGINNRIAFKAVGSKGKGILVSVAIVDIDGVEKFKISSSEFGMGIFGFNPDSGKTYQAIIDYQGETYTYDLPTAKEKGILMSVNNRKDDFRIYLQSTLATGIEVLKLVGRQGGEIVCEAKTTGNNPSNLLSISKDNLKQGIIQFTLYDKENRPFCERLAFVESKDFEPIVKVLPSRNSYKKRESVAIDITLKDDLKKNIQASMSIAITDMAVVEPDIYGATIKSQLLLNSELKGEIEHPNYYFESDDPNRKRLLDLLMMCQGWRRYIWNENVHDSIQKYPYAIENGFSFKGSVKKFINPKKKAVADVSLAFIDNNSIRTFEVKTNDQGKFEFRDFDIKDSTKVFIQAKNYKTNKSKDLKKTKKPLMSYTIMLDSIKTPEITHELIWIKTPYDSLFDNYVSRSKQRRYIDSLFDVKNGTIKLAEIKLQSVKSRIEKIKDKKRRTHSQPSKSIDFNDFPYIPSQNPLEALRGRVPRIFINSDGTAFFLGNKLSPNGKNATLLLDGMPIEDASSIDSYEIDFIDVFIGPQAAIYGSKGAGGIIAIYTKDGESELLRSEIRGNTKIRQGIISFVHPGFYQAKEFYSPKYHTEKPEHSKPDYRSTLYWNPDVQINAKGERKISFYSSDISTTFRVALEGLTMDGIPFTKELFIDVNRN